MQTLEFAANIMKERQKSLFLLGLRRRKREPFENLKAMQMNNRVNTGCVWITIPSTGNGVSDTEHAESHSYTDEMLSHNSANINMQVSNETLFPLADVAVSEAKSKSPNSVQRKTVHRLWKCWLLVCRYHFHKVSYDLTHRERLKGIYNRHIGEGFSDLYKTGVVRIFRPLQHVKVSK